MTYATPNNVSGIVGMADYLSSATSPVLGPLGSNSVAILLLVPFFMIILFGLLIRGERPTRAFSAAAFVCFLTCLPLILLGLVEPYVFGTLATLAFAGAAMSYLEGYS
jgi:hypothetical protein